MRIAQRQSPYVVPGAEDGGMFLSEHRRCVPEIIGYCNDLAYHGRLEPKRPSEPGYPLPRMGYAHVQGQSQRVGGSRRNLTEAQMIAAWIAERREFLEALPHESKDHPKPLLKDIVAVVTPFSAQAHLIRQELGKRGIDRVTVGTVHALQGLSAMWCCSRPSTLVTIVGASSSLIATKPCSMSQSPARGTASSSLGIWPSSIRAHRNDRRACSPGTYSRMRSTKLWMSGRHDG